MKSCVTPSLKGKAAWEDTKLGWYPFPKTERCKYSNELLPYFFETVWEHKKDPDLFRKVFITEVIRHWDIKVKLDKLKESFQFVLGNNPSALGQIFKGNVLKPGQNNILNNNLEKLTKTKQTLDSLISAVKENEADIFDSSGRTLERPYYTIQHTFNVKIRNSIDQFQDEIQSAVNKCEKLLSKDKQTFGLKGPSGRTDEGRTKRNLAKNRRKAVKRKIMVLRNQCRDLKKLLSPSLEIDIKSLLFDNPLIKIQDLYRLEEHTKCENQTNYVDIDSVNSIGVKYMKALHILFSKRVYTRDVECLIAQNLNSAAEKLFWDLYEQDECVDGYDSDKVSSESGDDESVQSDDMEVEDE